MLSSILAPGTGKSTHANDIGDEGVVLPIEKSAAESLVVHPAAQVRRLADIGAERRSFAA
jgi:hypothetical protein